MTATVPTKFNGAQTEFIDSPSIHYCTPGLCTASTTTASSEYMPIYKLSQDPDPTEFVVDWKQMMGGYQQSQAIVLTQAERRRRKLQRKRAKAARQRNRGR